MRSLRAFPSPANVIRASVSDGEDLNCQWRAATSGVGLKSASGGTEQEGGRRAVRMGSRRGVEWKVKAERKKE